MKEMLRLAALCVCLSLSGPALAEPHFALQQGFKCVACHVNPSGGGMRNAAGQAWGQTVLPAQRIDTGEPWLGEVGRFLAIGGNLRASGTVTDVPHRRTQSAFDVDEVRLYLEMRAIADRLSLYVDQRVAPGGSTNAEAYASFWSGKRNFYLKAGQMYLPYGLRLQDDSAFVRQVPGINFTTPDRGLEVGLETAFWSAQFAVTNGTAGGPATDEGKQYSVRVEHVRPRWRVGGSINRNDSFDGAGSAAAGTRQMQNIFAGVRTGKIAWLAEADYIRDDTLQPEREQAAGLIEANWLLRPGHNLKFTAEYFDPDTAVSHDGQNRFSMVWEFTPLQFAQLRVGVRNYDGIPQNDLQNRRLVFAQVNGYF